MGVMQFAYFSFHYVETALIKVQNNVFSALNEDFAFILLKLGLSTEFDTINHKSVLLRFTTCMVLEVGFMLGSKHTCVIESSVNINISDTNKLTFDVPRGSVFWPNLYCL